MTKINNGQGSLGMLLNNDSLYKNLNSSAADLDKLLIDFKANPKRYVHFSVFGKKQQ
jgi:phospholipid/cholesterol/gamma-HCH transport system substrate-binding protein